MSRGTAQRATVENLHGAIFRFIDWLDEYGETFRDHQSYFASDLGGHRISVLPGTAAGKLLLPVCSLDWETTTGTYEAETPMITSLPYMHEALLQVCQAGGNSEWLDVMPSIAQHALEEYEDYKVSPTLAAAGTPRARKTTRE